ncbi:Uncharacterised protein [Vibrio cholerae]|nr:Uncharacterised protein [Vibrio cholerae]CSI56087.1 Uncharacterised protein [Vibrio cholerae]CSI82011.1 Uncharacterised protein [Vibrio cholerae]
MSAVVSEPSAIPTTYIGMLLDTGAVMRPPQGA